MKTRDEFRDLDSLVKFYELDKQKLVNKVSAGRI